MPAVHTLRCVSCGSIERDHFFPSSQDVEPSNCALCTGKREILWTARGNTNHSWSNRDKIVVYKNSATGEVSYPGRNDLAMPDRYRQQGYERVEIASLTDYNRFEKETGVISQAMHFDNNGKVDREDTPPAPEISYSNLLE